MIGSVAGAAWISAGCPGQSGKARSKAIDKVLQPRAAAGDVPGIVAVAARRDGIFYEGAFGKRGLDGAEPMTVDSIFRIFSMTKAVGTASAMILVEQGKLDLDATVESYLPQFSELQVLDGFNGDAPILRPPRTKATIRHLATHTSGLVDEFWNANMAKYLKVTGNPSIISGLKAGLMYPLGYDPGERWDYGIGIDWLGQVVEAITGKAVDVYCREEIFQPLGMVDTDFECEGTRRDRLVTVHGRGEDGALSVIQLDPPSHPEVYGYGHALYSTARDYTQFLLMMMKRGTHNGAQILKPETVDLMMQNHIGDLFVNNLVTAVPAISNDAEFFPGMPKKHGLGFMINLEQAAGMRAADSQAWAGALNTYFWFDPANDVTGVILMQLLPFVDREAIDIFTDFEKAVYASV